MTKAEENVIQWACNLAEAVVAGDHHLPKPMNIAINNLQDAAWNLARERGWSSPKEGCSKEFLDSETKYWNELEEHLHDMQMYVHKCN